jgi:hypothetical protein
MLVASSAKIIYGITVRPPTGIIGEPHDYQSNIFGDQD